VGGGESGRDSLRGMHEQISPFLFLLLSFLQCNDETKTGGEQTDNRRSILWGSRLGLGLGRGWV